MIDVLGVMLELDEGQRQHELGNSTIVSHFARGGEDRLCLRHMTQVPASQDPRLIEIFPNRCLVGREHF